MTSYGNTPNPCDREQQFASGSGTTWGNLDQSQFVTADALSLPSASLDMAFPGIVPTPSTVAQEQQQPPIEHDDSAHGGSGAPGSSEVQLRNNQANTGSYNFPLFWATSGTCEYLQITEFSPVGMTLIFSAGTKPEQRGSPLSMNPSSSVPPLVGLPSFTDKSDWY